MRIMRYACALVCASAAFGQLPRSGGGAGGGVGGAANYKLQIGTTATSFTVDAATHKNGHAALIVDCLGSSGAALPKVASAPAAGQYAYNVNPTTFLVSITFGTGGNNGGWCTINGSGQGTPGPTGATTFSGLSDAPRNNASLATELDVPLAKGNVSLSEGSAVPGSCSTYGQKFRRATDGTLWTCTGTTYAQNTTQYEAAFLAPGYFSALAVGSEGTVSTNPDDNYAFMIKHAETRNNKHGIGLSNTYIWAPAANPSAKSVAMYDGLGYVVGTFTVPFYTHLATEDWVVNSTVTDHTGLAVKAPTVSGGTIVNRYGIDIGNQCGTGITNCYSIRTGSGLVDFANATALTVPSSAGASPTVSGRISYDLTAHKLVYGANGVKRVILFQGDDASLNSVTVNASGAGAPLVARTHASTVATDPFMGVQNSSNTWLGGFLGNGRYNNPNQTSGAAVFDASGTLVKATGTATDCVRVDGSSGACGSGGGGVIVDNDTLIDSGGVAAANTAVMQTRANDLQNKDRRCAPSGASSTAYTCNLAYALQAARDLATPGTQIDFVPDVACGANPTLAVNGTAALPLRRADSTTPWVCEVGEVVRLVHDTASGGMWKLVGPSRILKHFNMYGSGGVNAGATNYMALEGGLGFASGRRPTRILQQGVLRGMGIQFITTQVDPAMVCVVERSINGGSVWADTSITLTVSAATTAGASVGSPVFLIDNTNTLVVNAGDLLEWKCVNGSAGSSSLAVASFGVTRY